MTEYYKEREGGKKKSLRSSMPEICHHIRRSIDDIKKKLGIEIKANE